MANTTDFIITCVFDSAAVKEISKKTRIDFFQVSDCTKCGGDKVLSFESYGASYRSLGDDKIYEIISVFKSADFDYPEYAVLIIDDDNESKFQGVHVINNK